MKPAKLELVQAEGVRRLLMSARVLANALGDEHPSTAWPTAASHIEQALTHVNRLINQLPPFEAN